MPLNTLNLENITCSIYSILTGGQLLWTGIYRPTGTAREPFTIRYHSDDSLVVFAPWAAGQPDGGLSENCVYAAPKSKYLWDDIDCDKEIEFICEI